MNTYEGKLSSVSNNILVLSRAIIAKYFILVLNFVGLVVFVLLWRCESVNSLTLYSKLPYCQCVFFMCCINFVKNLWNSYLILFNQCYHSERCLEMKLNVLVNQVLYVTLSSFT